MTNLESALREVAFLKLLRRDEICRAAQRFTVRALAAGERLTLGVDSPTFAIVLGGRLSAAVRALPSQPDQRMVLVQGDSLGDVTLASGQVRPAELTALAPAEVAWLDAAGLAALLDDFPAVALPLVEVVAQELRFKDSLIRELGELEALGLTERELEGALSVRRRALRRHGTGVLRRATAAIYREVVVARGREPVLWMLLGFTASVVGARLVVGNILRRHLEHSLFALIQGAGDAHPMHLHHFNYGLLLVGLAGLGAFMPQTRPLARALPALFGVGAGLIFDEWALIWNLDPNYYQRLSYAAAFAVFALLLQLLTFRRFWTGWARRASQRWGQRWAA